MAVLLPFHVQVTNAWKTFVHRWGSAVILQLIALFPVSLMTPFLYDYYLFFNQGVDPMLIFFTSSYGAMFVVGVVLYFFLSTFSSTALMILFSARNAISFITAIHTAIRRYIPVLYTSILAAIAISIALIPFFFSTIAFPFSGNGLQQDGLLVVLLALCMVPVVIVGTYVMYAPLAVATASAKAGFPAIVFSKDLVHGHVWYVFWRLVGFGVLFQIASASVQTLPVAVLVLPFILTIIAVAFFVELYKELHEKHVRRG